jgi:hypothetical protein
MRSLAIAIGALLLAACEESEGAVDARVIDAAVDAACGPGGCAAEGEVCGSSPADLDAGARPCGVGLVCCYPCGIPDCLDRCTTPCSPPGPGCQQSGCPGPFP